MMDTRIPQLSTKARAAFQDELSKPAYQNLDEETAIYRAARALLRREDEEETVFFDRTNPADQIVLTLTFP